MNTKTESSCPGPTWQSSNPDALGFDAGKLADAIAFAERAETAWPRELESGLNADPTANEPAPWNEVLGPTKSRGGPNGLVIRNGRIAGSWGDTTRVDMTYSATKSYLALLTGIAVADGLIRNIDDAMVDYALDDGFESVQNRSITWRHMLQQTSEWEGTLWGKPDLIDRHRQVGPGSDNARKGTHRTLQKPGSFWEYNDVRVNRLSLSLMQVFKQPLPEVLAERIMTPIGASDTWRWHAYDNAQVEIDGTQMASVPGGAHWGGGLFISSEDHARVGWLVRNQGVWSDVQIIPPEWITTMLTPCALNPVYGSLWWLNTGKALFSEAPERSVNMMGAGQNLVWIAAELDLVCVMRWIDSSATDAVISRLLNALA